MVEAAQSRDLVGASLARKRLKAALSKAALACDRGLTRSRWTRSSRVAGAVGFGPTDHGTKTRCLTAWLRPTQTRRSWFARANSTHADGWNHFGSIENA